MNSKETAIKFRQDGLSIKEICEIISKPYTTVTRWVKNIKLTDLQELALAKRSPHYLKSSVAAKFYSKTHAENRESFREEGRKRVDNFKNLSDKELTLVGISLYWGEGTKTSKNELSFCNSDFSMIQVYILFLKRILNISEQDIRLEIQCYTDLETKENIIKFWLEKTGLNDKNLKYILVNNKPISSKQKRKGKSKYGTCYLKVNKTDKIQNMLGMLESLSGFRNAEWGLK
jgi:hypothetical protein